MDRAGRREVHPEAQTLLVIFLTKQPKFLLIRSIYPLFIGDQWMRFHKSLTAKGLRLAFIHPLSKPWTVDAPSTSHLPLRDCDSRWHPMIQCPSSGGGMWRVMIGIRSHHYRLITSSGTLLDHLTLS